MNRFRKIVLAIIVVALGLGVVLVVWGSGGSDNTAGTQAPATTQQTVVQYDYEGHANGGTYTLSETRGLQFEWPYQHCVRFYPAHGVSATGDAANHLGRFVSRDGEVEREFKELAPGETWHNYTCPG